MNLQNNLNLNEAIDSLKSTHTNLQTMKDLLLGEYQKLSDKQKKKARYADINIALSDLDAAIYRVNTAIYFLKASKKARI
jgi:hypothetical protein